MSYVDLIIKYLSGDLSREESSAFEKELEINDELRLSFEEQSAAFELIRDQLQKRDLSNFKAKLADAMSKDAPSRVSREAGRKSWWFIPLAVACSLAFIFILFLRDPGNERLLSRYHKPANDPVMLAYYQNTRGEPDPGISQYLHGNYARAMELLSAQLTGEGDNKLILIYYLLSAMELDRQQEVLQGLRLEQDEEMDLLDQSLSWYSALALIKSDSREAALEKLHPLTMLQGPYQSDAIKLEKVLLK